MYNLVDIKPIGNSGGSYFKLVLGRKTGFLFKKFEIRSTKFEKITKILID